MIYAILPPVFLLPAYAADIQGAEPQAVLLLSGEDGQLLLETPIDPRCGFAVRYTHSVALSPVTDYFSIKDHDIYLDKTVYHDFGAGLPHMPDKNQTMSTSGGELTISGFKRKLGKFFLRVGRVANHQLLLLNGDCEVEKAYPLSQLAKPGSPIIFKAR